MQVCKSMHFNMHAVCVKYMGISLFITGADDGAY